MSDVDAPVTCWWCQQPYERTDLEQRFCSSAHAEKARRARRRRDARRAEAILAAGRALCPHPYKVTYATYEGAELARLDILEKRGDALRTYRCVCGALHLGHTVPAIEEAINRQLRTTRGGQTLGTREC